MDLSKSYEFFQPEKVTGRIHIIGCGSVGSTVAELLARLGLTKITLYDMDKVEEHNLANQMFTTANIHQEKVLAVAERMKMINPDIEKDLILVRDGWHGQKLSGYVFLCVDNIDLRRKIATENVNNPFVKAMMDFRTRLTDSQHYAADWRSMEQKKRFINSMDFTQEEADEATPVSACNVNLCVMPTVWSCCMAGVCNLVNFVSGKDMQPTVLTDPFNHYAAAF